MLRAGIVGLPNVGKSTLFNALTATKNAQSANYPFCTIEPNVGVVTVPDERLQILCNLCKAKEIIPTVIEFVDIAGLVKGASNGEGLGNQFLHNIREVDAIIQVVRCFDDENTIHVSGKVNPIDDIETINTELALADLSTVEKRAARIAKQAKGGDKDAVLEDKVLKKLTELLSDCKFINVNEHFDDVSKDALNIAKKNVNRHQLSARVSCVQADALAPAPGFLGKFDLIVSNPPYIPTVEMAEVDGSVKDYEPHLALDGGKDGLDFYRSIVKNYSSALKPGGYMCFEFGMGQGDDVCQILKDHGYTILERVEDFNNRERAVLAQLGRKED